MKNTVISLKEVKNSKKSIEFLENNLDIAWENGENFVDVLLSDDNNLNKIIFKYLDDNSQEYSYTIQNDELITIKFNI